MAIDGVKIIDSDQAYDIYNEVVGRYRDGDPYQAEVWEVTEDEE